jgi:hypothetical protein
VFDRKHFQSHFYGIKDDKVINDRDPRVAFFRRGE